MKKQSQKFLWGAVGLVALLIGIKALSSSAAPVESVSNASLSIAEMKWDIGDVAMSKGISQREVELTNTSGTPITVTQMSTSCMCTTVQIVHSDGKKSGLKGMTGHGGGTSSLSETIKNGETAKLVVNFDPNAHGPSATGPITRTISLQTNSKKQPNIELTFSGNVVK